MKRRPEVRADSARGLPGRPGPTVSHLVRELERRHAEHAALLKGSRAILEQRDFKHSARAIFRACKELTGATSGYVVLLREDRPEYDVVYMDVGDHSCTVDPNLPMPLRGLREQVYRLSKVVYENNFADSPWMRLLPSGHVTLENVLFAPLLLKGRVLGMIGLGNKPEGFTGEDARLAADFAEMATLALLNSRTRELLEQSEQRFRSVAQTAVDGIVSVDHSETVVFWNVGAERIFGYASGEMLGQPINRIIPERFAVRHQAHFQETLAATQADFVRPPREVLGRHKDGREIPLELSIARWRTAGEVYFTTIIRDITDRKKAETDLRHAHDELETRVQQRTAELENAVKLLEAEVCSRKQAERHSQGIASLLELFAVSTQRQDYLDSVARLLRDWARCQGAGIRLFDERGHLPFAAHAGFNREFVNSENRMRLNADPCACLRVLQHRPRLVVRLLLLQILYDDEALRDVFQRGLVFKQVVQLKHHGGLSADGQLLVLGRVPRVDCHVAHRDGAFIRLFQEVDAAQQRGLARAAGAEDRHDLAVLNRHVNAPEHLVFAKRLAHTLYLDHRNASTSAMPSFTEFPWQ